MASGYLNKIMSLSGRKEICDSITLAIANSGLDYQGIAVSGVSGLVIGPIIAAALNKHLIIVRKEIDKENSHASYLVEENIVDGGLVRFQNYIIIDDLICNGTTIKRILLNIKNLNNHGMDALSQSNCKGIFLYERHGVSSDTIQRDLDSILKEIALPPITIYFLHPSDIKDKEELMEWKDKKNSAKFEIAPYLTTFNKEEDLTGITEYKVTARTKYL